MREEDLRRFLAEDGVGWRDVTSGLVAGHDASATVRSREDGVAAGVAEAGATFEELDAGVEALVDDGDRIEAGDPILRVEGPAEGLLAAERLALNLLMSMSGVATATRRAVDRAGGIGVAATRKTTPGFRYYEKRAVRLGGGDTHRYDLSDAVLIKENHVAILGLETAIRTARERASFTTVVEAEVESREEAVRAADAGADAVLLDNLPPDEAADCAAALPGNVTVEASGGITPDTVAEYADAGVDVVSMGSLTHSSNWLDATMLVD